MHIKTHKEHEIQQLNFQNSYQKEEIYEKFEEFLSKLVCKKTLFLSLIM